MKHHQFNTIEYTKQDLNILSLFLKNKQQHLILSLQSLVAYSFDARRKCLDFVLMTSSRILHTLIVNTNNLTHKEILSLIDQIKANLEQSGFFDNLKSNPNYTKYTEQQIEQLQRIQTVFWIRHELHKLMNLQIDPADVANDSDLQQHVLLSVHSRKIAKRVSHLYFDITQFVQLLYRMLVVGLKLDQSQILSILQPLVLGESDYELNFSESLVTAFTEQSDLNSEQSSSHLDHKLKLILNLIKEPIILQLNKNETSTNKQKANPMLLTDDLLIEFFREFTKIKSNNYKFNLQNFVKVLYILFSNYFNFSAKFSPRIISSDYSRLLHKGIINQIVDEYKQKCNQYSHLVTINELENYNKLHKILRNYTSEPINDKISLQLSLKGYFLLSTHYLNSFTAIKYNSTQIMTNPSYLFDHSNNRRSELVHVEALGCASNRLIRHFKFGVLKISPKLWKGLWEGSFYYNTMADWNKYIYRSYLNINDD